MTRRNTPNIEITRKYNPDIAAQLTALEVLLRSPPKEEDTGIEAAPDEQLAGDIRGQDKGERDETHSLK